MCPSGISCLTVAWLETLGPSALDCQLCVTLYLLLDLPVPACLPIERALDSGFWPDAVPASPSSQCAVNSEALAC